MIVFNNKKIYTVRHEKHNQITSMMALKIFLIILNISSITLATHKVSTSHPRKNFTMNRNSMNTTKMREYNGSEFENSLLCNRTEKEVMETNIDNYQASRAISSTNIFDPNDVQPRSYYGYGGNNTPAFYPAFDSLSILASLAFLAFLLQSFASLFDRSRSIIPTIVNGRRTSSTLELLDPVKIVSHALEGYKILNENTVPSNTARRRRKLSRRNL